MSDLKSLAKNGYITQLNNSAIGQIIPSTGVFTSLVADSLTTINQTITGDLTVADKIVHLNDTNTNIRFPAADTVTVETSGLERIRIDASGNVGIGISPAVRLHSYQFFGGTTARLQTGTTANGNFLDFYNASSTRQGLVGFIDSTNLHVHNDAAASIIFDTSDTERMRIDQNGNVGIGVTTPGRILSASTNAKILAIDGSITLPYTVTGAEPFRIGAFDNTNFVAGASSVGTAAGLTISNWNAVGNGSTAIQAGIDQGAGGIVLQARKTNTSIVSNLVSFELNQTSFYTANTERLRIDSAGNVGIGTSSPSTALHINRSGATDSALFLSNGTAGTEATQSADGNFYLLNYGAHNLIFGTNATERVRIHAAGGVSIGNTADPGTGGLNVNGKLFVSGYSMMSSHLLDLSALATNTFYPVTITIANPSRGARLRINNALNTNVPAWSTHPNGFSLSLDWNVNAGGYGTIGITRYIHRYMEAWSSSVIVGGLSQMGNSSQEVVWLRGGGIYLLESDQDVTPTVRTTSYTIYDETVAPTTTAINTVWSAATGFQSIGSLLIASTLTSNGDVSAPNFNSTSDLTTKENIEVIVGAIDKVSKINGVTFNFIHDDTKRRHVGVIAQEVEKVLPEAVRETSDGIKNVAYGNLVGLLIEAIKEQQKQIDELKALIQK